MVLPKTQIDSANNLKKLIDDLVEKQKQENAHARRFGTPVKITTVRISKNSNLRPDQIKRLRDVGIAVEYM